eukprot:763100-Hanusia_phi.AAC.12
MPSPFIPPPVSNDTACTRDYCCLDAASIVSLHALVDIHQVAVFADCVSGAVRGLPLARAAHKGSAGSLPSGHAHATLPDTLLCDRVKERLQAAGTATNRRVTYPLGAHD